jgi:hypothetical protein
VGAGAGARDVAFVMVISVRGAECRTEAVVPAQRDLN